jgi:hypothetical protein
VRRYLITGLVLGLFLLPFEDAGGQDEALEFTGDFQIRANRSAHWRNWLFQNTFAPSIFSIIDSTGLFDITDAGIKPKYYHGSQNFALSRSQFSYEDDVRFGGTVVQGNITALSNPDLASLVGDGDPQTFWEPAVEDFSKERLHSWQLEVDLGRTVWADSIVVLFPPIEGIEDAGDPLKLFTISTSVGQAPLGGGGRKELRFEVVGKISVLENTQRRVVLPLEPFGQADFSADGKPDISGSFLHYVRVTAFDSDFFGKEFLGSGEEGRSAYDDLAPERQGLKVFQRVSAGGILIRVDSTTYFGQLEEEQRGPIRYFRRELPRVAEIEIWGKSVNLAYRPERHGGASFEDGGRGDPSAITDGLYITQWSSQPWEPKFSSNAAGSSGNVGRTVWLDLGASFWINAIYIGSEVGALETASAGGGITGYHMLGSAGRTVQPLSIRDETDFAQLEFGLAWTDLLSDIHRDNTTARAHVLGEFFPLRKLRFLQLRNVIPEGFPRDRAAGQTGDFTEVQMYGRGYPAEVNLTSPPSILLPGMKKEDAGRVDQNRSLARIFWNAEAVVCREDPLTGQMVEAEEPLELHPEVELRLQTRTSDTIDSVFTYYEVTGVGTNSEKRTEIPFETYLKRVADVAVFATWDALPESREIRLRPHATARDDDGDNRIDEDLMDEVDNDGDGLVDEDGLTGDRGGPNNRGTITLLKHKRKQDDDGDGLVDEDGIDGVDEDGDGLIDEDGKKPADIRKFPDLTITPVFAGWSPWSPPYRPIHGRNEATILSPSPRKFLQTRAIIASSSPDVTVRLKSVAIDLAPPISTEVVGELAILTEAGFDRPVRDLQAVAADYAAPIDIEPAVDQPYAYFVRAAGPDSNVAGVADGFNELLLVTPSSVKITGLRLGRVKVTTGENGGTSARRAVETHFEQGLVRTAETRVLRSEGDGEIKEVAIATSGDSVLLSFPISVNRGAKDLDHVLVEVRFLSKTPRAGTQFQAFVRNRQLNGERGVLQRVSIMGQDATELVDSQTVTPLILIDNRLVGGVEISPIFTPNGDHINDQLQVSFVLLHLLADRPVSVDFFDLAGRRVAGEELAGRSGEMYFAWDGRNAAGDLVSPGIYLCRIKVETDRKSVVVTRAVHVVY